MYSGNKCSATTVRSCDCKVRSWKVVSAVIFDTAYAFSSNTAHLLFLMGVELYRINILVNSASHECFSLHLQVALCTG